MEQEDERQSNYIALKAILDKGLEEAAELGNPRDAKAVLIDVQQHFRGLQLFREDREELYQRLQSAFQVVNKKIEDENHQFEVEAEQNYLDLCKMNDEIQSMFNKKVDNREIWAKLLLLQDEIRARKLKREDRMELTGHIQDAFTLIKMEREEQQRLHQAESTSNYQRLKTLVDQGLKQAEESHEYKDTREFLKKIQSEFKGLKMEPAQREELYSRLQTAFDILGTRLDDYFHNKKKNWETRMNFTLARLETDIHDLSSAIEKEEQNLDELLDQLEIMESSGRESSVILAQKARITSVRGGIELKKSQLTTLTNEHANLKNRLEQ
jgi:hypothetical protein